MKNSNKKGMVDDLIEILFFVILSTVIIISLNLFFMISIDGKNENVIETIESTQFNELKNLHQRIIFETEQVIVNCNDYSYKEDCNMDIFSIKKNNTDQYCHWNQDSKNCELKLWFTNVKNRVN